MDHEATQLAGKATSADPAVGLAGVASLRVLLDALERLQVENARAEGWAWQRIAASLGVSKQAVHQKYGDGRKLPGQGRR